MGRSEGVRCGRRKEEGMKKEKKGAVAVRKPLSKKTGITIFTLIMLIMGVIIVCYHNPLAILRTSF